PECPRSRGSRSAPASSRAGSSATTFFSCRARLPDAALASDGLSPGRGEMKNMEIAPVAARTVLRPTRGWVAIDFRELIRFKDLLFQLASRDVKLRYKQT